MLIHASAIVSKQAKLGSNVSVGPYTIIHDNVEIGDDSSIGSHCEIGVSNAMSKEGQLKIGKHAQIRSHSIFYENSIFGDNLVTGHRVTVREKTFSGKNLQIGTLCDVQGHCEIGDYVRFHSNVHIGQQSKIGNYVWIFPYVVLTNDPHPPSNTLKGVSVGDFSVIATMSVILPGAVIEPHVLVGAHSSLKGLAESGFVYAGSPAKKICATGKIIRQDGSNESAYPWTKHFQRGYPAKIIENWALGLTSE